jgi:hypothetical protein
MQRATHDQVQEKLFQLVNCLHSVQVAFAEELRHRPVGAVFRLTQGEISARRCGTTNCLLCHSPEGSGLLSHGPRKPYVPACSMRIASSQHLQLQYTKAIPLHRNPSIQPSPVKYSLHLTRISADAIKDWYSRCEQPQFLIPISYRWRGTSPTW